MSNKNTVTLTNLGLKFLQEMLSAPGWATTPEDIYRAGQIVSDILPEQSEEPKPPQLGSKTPEEELKAAHENFKIAINSWSDTIAPAIELSNKQFVAVQKAINFFIGKGSLPPSKHSSRLLLEFKLVEAAE